jgi:MCP family monocarboxylic acid transporter-like MFS transporter 10
MSFTASMRSSGSLDFTPVRRFVRSRSWDARCCTRFLPVLTYIDVAATQVGINADIAFYLVAVANGCSIFGRALSSWLAIRYGAMNALLPFTLLAGLLTWVWPYINQTGSYAGLVALAVFYGASSGAFIAVLGTPMSHPSFGEMGDLGRRTGMLWSICAIGALIGPPISGAINTATDDWKAVGWYAGKSKVCWTVKS